mgnify:CR=1 FL=1
MEFINEIYINNLLENEKLLNEDYQKDLIKKGSEAKGLNLKEAAALLNINSPELLEELYHTAKNGCAGSAPCENDRDSSNFFSLQCRHKGPERRSGSLVEKANNRSYGACDVYGYHHCNRFSAAFF